VCVCVLGGVNVERPRHGRLERERDTVG